MHIQKFKGFHKVIWMGLSRITHKLKKAESIIGKNLKKIKDKTFYDPETPHNFLVFEMVGPIEPRLDSQTLLRSEILHEGPILSKKRESGLYKKQGPWYKLGL